MHVDKRNKDILNRGKGQRQELDDTTLTAEATYQFISSFDLYISIIYLYI